MVFCKDKHKKSVEEIEEHLKNGENICRKCTW